VRTIGTGRLATPSFVLVVVMACGGSPPARSNAPLENRTVEKPSAAPQSSRPAPIANAAEARAQLPALTRALEDLDDKLADAVTAIADARTDLERQLAIDRLTQLQKKQDELSARIEEAYDVIERDTGERPNIDSCRNNPLAACP
jgi:hypothetical protein